MDVRKPVKSRKCKKCKETKRPKSFRVIGDRHQKKWSMFCKSCQWEMPYSRYNARDSIVKGLHFKSYKTYLRSPLWRDIRKRVFERDENKCRICKEPSKHVHHQRYNPATMSGRDISELVSLCASCHHFNEFDQDGKKLDVLQVKKRVKRAIEEAEATRYADDVIGGYLGL